MPTMSYNCEVAQSSLSTRRLTALAGHGPGAFLLLVIALLLSPLVCAQSED